MQLSQFFHATRSDQSAQKGNNLFSKILVRDQFAHLAWRSQVHVQPDDAIRLMRENSLSRVLVVNDAMQLAGVVRVEDLGVERLVSGGA